MLGRDIDVKLRATQHPEFDAWRWSNYWVSLDAVIDFKREVYTQALNELSPLIFKRGQEARCEAVPDLQLLEQEIDVGAEEGFLEDDESTLKNIEPQADLK
jgi:hypothetical protein